MKLAQPYLGCLLLLVSGWAAAQVSSWDEDQLRALQHYSTALRWDNIEGAPHWVSGIKPRHDFRQRLHFMDLAPGEAVVFRADAKTWLRLAGKTRTLRPEDLEIEVSGDGRMFVEATPIATVDRYALLVALPRDNASLVRLRRPGQASTNLVFAAYCSRVEPLEVVAPYREAVRLPGKSVRLRREGEAGPKPAWPVTPGDPIELSLKGPARLQLVTLLRWPLSEPLREQSLTLHITQDEAEPIPVLLSPELDSRHRTWVDGSAELVSRRMSGYFNVPDGHHRLRLEASAPAYVSVYRQSHPDFLLPGLNGPRVIPEPQLQPTTEQQLDLSSNAPATTSPPRTTAGWVALEQEAWRLARNNQPMDAGAQAADWLHRLGQPLENYPPARRTVETLRSERTIYRELLPRVLPGGHLLKEAFFTPQRLRPLFEPERPIAVYNPTLDQVEGMLVKGRFVTIPSNLFSGLLYELPERSYDSELRIAALTSSAARTQLLVQFDDEPPIQVSLDAVNALPQELLAVSGAIGTLRALEKGARSPMRVDGGTAFGEFDLPFELTTPGVIELPLPQQARQLRIYGETNTSPVSVSVAYRAAKPFQFEEMAYLALLDQVGVDAAMQMLVHPQETPRTSSALSHELRNHLLPLARRLRSHANDFGGGADAYRSPRAEPPLGSETTRTVKESARTLESNGQLVEAIGLWNRLFWEGTTTDQTQAALAIMDCLNALDEEFLATQYARYVLLNVSDSTFPVPAVALLESAAQQAEDPHQLEQLRAFLFLRCPCAEHLSALTEALMLNGEDELALTTGLMLPREQMPVERMLEAALHQNWWLTFERLVEQLGQAEAKGYWRAQQHLAFLRFSEAEQQLQQAGDSGREMLHALQRGMAIREQLGAVELSDRLAALLEWEQWQTHQPGARTWRTATDVEQECSASELLFNPEQNQFSTHLRCEPTKPVHLRFLGPLRLRVEARPILDEPFEQPVNDWLEVAEYGITNRIPVSQCVPNPDLHFTTDNAARVGMKTQATLEWGPGWHEVQVALASHPALIRVLQEQPVLPTRILPTLNARRMHLVLHATQSPGPEPEIEATREEPGFWWLPPDMGRPKPVSSDAFRPSGSDVINSETFAEATSLTTRERLRLALRLSSPPVDWLTCERDLLQKLPQLEQWLAVCRGQRWIEFTNWADLPETMKAGGWLATDRIQELLDSDVPNDVVTRLTALLEIAELFPAWSEQARCQAEFIAAQTNCPPEAQRILLRLVRDRIWTPLNVSPTSAGIRPLSLSVDLPQDPSTRLRRALLPPAHTNQFTLSAQSELTASVTLKQAATLRLHAVLVKAGFAPLTPMRVGLQVDASEIQYLPLTVSAPEITTHIALPEGPHRVRLWIDDPVVNQWVRVSISGNSEDLAPAFGSQPLAQVASERRFFHAATSGQPLQFSWKGPALLRVDEDREGRFISHLQLVPPGEQTVEIPPAPDREESWYQVFVRTTDTNHPQKRVALALRQPETVPPPKLHLPDTAAPSQAQLTDYYRLGGQEDGTWSPSLLWVHRRPFELVTSQNTVENEFAEANVAYRKVTPSETVWFKTEALGRLHRPGDLTLGLSERVEGHPLSSLFDWLWRGEGFVGTVGPQQQDIQYSLYTDLELRRRFELNRKLDCYPLAGLFAHYLSLDADSASTYDYIDQDLYTPYRDDHRWGGMLGTQLEYQPWLDTLLKGNVHLASNENFTPDHVGLRFTWTQLMGPLRGRASYRCRYFMNDEDRSGESLLQGVSAGLYAEHWINGRHRIEIGAEYGHDWPDSGDSYFVVLRWDFSQGRRYRDYAPQEMVFRDLRSRRIPGAFNNLLEPGPPGTYLP